ncbi:MAG: threonine aldolase family protein, partial [Pseudomonadota bacterium]
MVIDLRSDTVTHPTPAMRKAMADAEVGDDYYRDDPTVRALEERAAAMLGKEAGLLVFSATMANAVALLAHTQRGDSIILEESCHINNNEAGHLGVIAGLTTRTVKGERGFIAPERLAEVALPRGEVLHAPTTLACLENTHNASGGACIAPAQMRRFRSAADKLRLAVHVDGARFFNASVALGVA